MDLATLAGGAYAALPYMIAGTTLGFVVVIPVAVYGASAAYGHSVANDCRDFNYDRSLQHAPSGSE